MLETQPCPSCLKSNQGKYYYAMNIWSQERQLRFTKYPLVQGRKPVQPCEIDLFDQIRGLQASTIKSDTETRGKMWTMC